MNIFFNDKDKLLFKEKGINEATILDQIEIFKKGITFLKLKAPAFIENGIKKFDEKMQNELCRLYDDSLQSVSVLKFVPASGAASRMFKDMFTLKDKCINGELDEKSIKAINDFFKSITRFAFFKELKKIMTNDGVDVDKCLSEKDFLTFSEYILSEKGFNYANTPKALIKFHDYGSFVRAAVEEHLVEAALYGENGKDETNLHFTISPEHKESFVSLIEKVIKSYSELFNIKYNISYSVQRPSTDTIAVERDNMPFRETNGSLLFRPAGHGALIENLNDCKEEMIFIKNIDNVVPDRLKETTVHYKKIIGGLLIHLKDKIKEYLICLEGESINNIKLQEIASFAQSELFINIYAPLLSDEKKLKAFLFNKLNRPIRVCGMVVNEGEPGGGPFWVVKESTGEVSLQIVESSQIAIDDVLQKSFLKQSTHFNPVDLVCWTYDYKGHKFNLKDYVDKETGFISIKSKDGQELKALELPGLWNGAMADWITVFVDVPLITFNPVKTIDDLLRKEHDALDKIYDEG